MRGEPRGNVSRKEIAFGPATSRTCSANGTRERAYPVLTRETCAMPGARPYVFADDFRWDEDRVKETGPAETLVVWYALHARVATEVVGSALFANHCRCIIITVITTALAEVDQKFLGGGAEKFVCRWGEPGEGR